MLVGAGDGGVHRDVPGDQPLGVGPGLQLFKDAVPGAVPLPAPEQSVDRLPRAVPLAHVPPGSTGAGAPAYAVYQLQGEQEGEEQQGGEGGGSHHPGDGHGRVTVVRVPDPT